MFNKEVARGFTLIELMMVVAIVAVLLSLALPAYQDYTIRSKVTEGLSIAAGIKANLSELCQSNPVAAVGSISQLGYSGPISSEYVEIMEAASLVNCEASVIGFRTINTGAEIEPVVYLMGQMQAGNMQWSCYLVMGEARHVPQACRHPFALIPVTP